MIRTLLAAALCALASPSVLAQQEFRGIPGRPYDPLWRPNPDPTMNCAMLPETGPDPHVIGLPAALAAAENRSLTLAGLSVTLRWADHEADPAHIPALKRLVEEYRCSSDLAEMALAAIESAGEPIAYFLNVAAGWDRDDRLSMAAMSVLGTRGDSSAYEPLRAIVLAASSRGPRAQRPDNAFSNYLGGIRMWGHFGAMPPQRQLAFAGTAAFESLGALRISTPTGVALSEEQSHTGGHFFAIPRRALRRLARVYPSAVESTIVAYADSSAARLRQRGVAEMYIPLYLAVADQTMRGAAYPPGAPPLPPEVTSASLLPSVCVEPAHDPWTGLVVPGLVAQFGYMSGETSAVRVPYGDANRVEGANGVLPPEVFYPPDEAPVGNPFRVALTPGDIVSWTLLGQTVTANGATRRCGDPVVPVCDGQTATIYVGVDGHIVGGPLDGQVYAGILEGSDGPDVIAGTPAPDLIYGRGGNDILCGGLGDDALLGGASTDTADGGDGTDGCNVESMTSCEGPVPALAHVEPLAECVVLHPNGRYTAYFGYNNSEGRPGEVAHGADNQLMLRPLDRLGELAHKPVQTKWFAVPGVMPRAPGQTAPFPSSAVAVTVGVGDAVVWHLLGQEAVLSPASPTCPTP